MNGVPGNRRKSTQEMGRGPSKKRAALSSSMQGAGSGGPQSRVTAASPCISGVRACWSAGDYHQVIRTVP